VTKGGSRLKAKGVPYWEGGYVINPGATKMVFYLVPDPDAPPETEFEFVLRDHETGMVFDRKGGRICCLPLNETCQYCQNAKALWYSLHWAVANIPYPGTWTPACDQCYSELWDCVKESYENEKFCYEMAGIASGTIMTGGGIGCILGGPPGCLGGVGVSALVTGGFLSIRCHVPLILDLGKCLNDVSLCYDNNNCVCPE